MSALGSKYHFVIFWGFIVITIGPAETHGPGASAIVLLAACIGAGSAEGILGPRRSTVLGAGAGLVGFAVFRRIVLQPRLIPMSRDAAAILGAIGLLMVTLLRDAAGSRAAPVADASLVGTVVLLLAFLNYLLYSKHSHILAALPNIYFRNLGQRGVMPKLNMEADDIAATGVVQEWKDFTWKSLLDGFACTECARCTNFCPAFNTGKPLSPMQVVHDCATTCGRACPTAGRSTRCIERFQHGRPPAARQADEVMPLIGGRTTEDVLWACTTCGACQEVCPVFIDHPRRSCRCARTWCWCRRRCRPIWRAPSPTSSATATRGASPPTSAWTGPRARRPDAGDKPDAEYLLWVGCAGAFDDRIKKQTRALVEVLQEAGVDFAVLGLEEGCSAIRRGAPATRCCSRCRRSKRRDA